MFGPRSLTSSWPGDVLANENSLPSLAVSSARQSKVKIDVSKDVCSIVFLSDGKHVVSGGYGGKVQVWQAGDGQLVGTTMNAGSTTVLNIAVSLDGKWIITGTGDGRVIVWDAKCHEKVTEFKGHGNWVRAVDVSPDSMRVASGSDDKTVCVWGISSRKRLLGPLDHDCVLAAVKFSPNGDLLATATWWKESVRIYNSQDGYLLMDIPIRVNSYENQSLAWLPDSLLLFALSFDGDIKCFDVSTQAMRANWPVYPGGNNTSKCMMVAGNGKFVAVSEDSSIIFWDTTTHKQIRRVIAHSGIIRSVAISPSYDVATGGGKGITIWNLDSILPARYVDDVTCSGKDPAGLIRGNIAAAAAKDDVDRFDPVTNSDLSIALQHLHIDETSKSYDECFPNDLTNHVKRDDRDPVASGGFADIYRGVLQTHWEPLKVAIKAIKTYSADNGNFFKKQKRLRREIKVWLCLRHTNVLPLLGTTAGFGRFPAMVSPWVENGCLTSYLEEYYDILSIVEILTLLNDAASGLQYLHSCSVVHGDLSGSNVLVCKNKRAYISDFGLSTLLTELGGPTFATSVHERGTLRWTAPELLDLQMSEDETESNFMPTTYSDMYSFGGVMLQILTGKVPYYYYPREAQVVHAVSKGMTPRRPSSVLVTDRRWMIIQRCWSTVEPSQSRPSSEAIVCFTNEELQLAWIMTVSQQKDLWL